MNSNCPSLNWPDDGKISLFYKGRYPDLLACASHVGDGRFCTGIDDLDNEIVLNPFELHSMIQRGQFNHCPLVKHEFCTIMAVGWIYHQNKIIGDNTWISIFKEKYDDCIKYT